MKVIKKITAIMLSIMMVLGMCSVVGAAEAGAEGTGTITINNAIVGQDYKIYKILTLESYDSKQDTDGKEIGLYSYKPAKGWDEFFKEPGKGSQYVDINDNGYVTWKSKVSEDKAAELAQEALEYAKNSANQSKFDSQDIKNEHANAETVKFTGLPLGYYLVDSSAGALCSLDTTKSTATIEEKNGVPSVKKEVQEDSKGDQNSAWGNENTADIGQKVNFKTTITAKKGAENYVLHDTMSDGLTFDANSVNVKLKKKNDGSEETLKAAQYALVKPGTETEGTKCTFEVKFEKALCDTLENDDQLIVTYSATLNDKAEIGNTGNKNETKLTYGDNNKTETATTTTRTFEIPVFKYTLKDNKETALKDATFTLSKDSVTTPNTKEIIKLRKKNGTAEEEYLVDSNGEEQVTTTATGKFKIQGLDAGTYYLTETQQPAGYNKLKAPITIKIDDEGKIYVNEAEEVNVGDVKVLNNTGSLLPSTGGMGTTLFYIFGAILVIGSGVVLITKKRMK